MLWLWSERRNKTGRIKIEKLRTCIGLGDSKPSTLIFLTCLWKIILHSTVPPKAKMTLEDTWAIHASELWFTATVWIVSGYWSYKNKLRGSPYQLLEASVIARLAKLDFQAWIYLSLTSCVSMNKLTNLSDPQFPHLQNDSQFHELQYYIDSRVSKWQRKLMNAWNSICFMETLYWELPTCPRHCA